MLFAPFAQFFFKRDSVSLSSSPSGGLILISLHNGDSFGSMVSTSASGRHSGLEDASLDDSPRTTLACADRSFEERQRSTAPENRFVQSTFMTSKL